MKIPHLLGVCTEKHQIKAIKFNIPNTVPQLNDTQQQTDFICIILNLNIIIAKNLLFVGLTLLLLGYLV